MTNPRTVRRLGWALLVIGLLLVGGVGVIGWTQYPAFSHPGVQQANGTTFTGTAEQAHDAFQLFLGLMAFGVLTILNGAWQIATGRRSAVFLVLTLAVSGALFFGVRGMLAPGGSFGG